MNAGRVATKGAQGPAYLMFVLGISVLSLVILAALAFLHPDPAVAQILGYGDSALCLLFFLDFLVTLARAPNRRRYLRTWGWLDLLSSVPTLPAFRVVRVARVVRVLRVLRGMRSVRILTTFVLERRAQNTMVAATLVAILLLIFGSVAILQFESVPEANIKGAQDALWWSVVTLTTVGYGDHYPVTAEGRLIAAVLMIAGVGLFGALSGFVASWFLAPAGQGRETEIAALRREIRELREQLVEARTS